MKMDQQNVILQKNKIKIQAQTSRHKI